MRSGSSSPCGSCKWLRRRCTTTCILAPYFPPHEPYKFAMVHKIFGASNITKMLQELPEDQRADAANSMIYEANARMQDPVYGCVGMISFLRDHISRLEMQLAAAQAEILSFQRPLQQARITFPVTQMNEEDNQNLVSFSNENSSNSTGSFQEVEDYYLRWT